MARLYIQVTAAGAEDFPLIDRLEAEAAPLTPVDGLHPPGNSLPVEEH